MIKKAVYRSSGRRVRGEDDKIPPIKTAAPDLPLDVLRNMDIRFDFVVCTHLCAAERLAHSPRKRQIEWRARQSERRFKSRRVEPVRPPPDRHARSHMQHRLLHLAGSRTAQRSPSTRTSGTSRRRTDLVVNASTRRYLSVDAVTEHIASEMRLILRSDKGKAGVLYRACLDLPSAACPRLRALGWSITPPALPTSEGLSSVAGSRRTRQCSPGGNIRGHCRAPVPVVGPRTVPDHGPKGLWECQGWPMGRLRAD